MEKRTPHCALSIVKALVAEGKVRTTYAAELGAAQMGLGTLDILEIVRVKAKRFL